MRRGFQKKLAEKSNFSEGYISMILSGKRRPSWQTAKILTAITGIKITLWLEGTPEEIRNALMRTDTEKECP